MGSTAHVLVNEGGNRLLGRARRRVTRLEARWNRLLDRSEISRLNRQPGRPVRLSPDTFALVAHAVAAWEATAGRFDPTVVPAAPAADYDRDFAMIGTGADDRPSEGQDEVAASAAPGCSDVQLDPERQTVTLPVGVEIDPGGIGKGLAADLVSAELVASGAAGAMVDLGGDVRVRGRPPAGDSWSIAVEHPLHPDHPLLELGLLDGGVAASSRMRWRPGQYGAARHDLIDPRTGRPPDNSLVAAIAIARDAWWAEAITKSVFVAGVPADQAYAPDALVATVDLHGDVELSPDLAAATV